MSDVMEKRPDELLDYVFDFTRWLSSGDTINPSGATATISSTVPCGQTATAAVDHVTNDNTTATVWVKTGIDGETAEVVVSITTSLGRKKDGVLKLRIRD